MARRVSRAVVIGVTVLLGLLAIAQLVPIGGHSVARWLAIDTCLDRGGAWDYARARCALTVQP